MTAQDARERAWKPETATPREKFIFGQGVRYGARLKGLEDQRIAALVAALASADSMLTLMWHRYRSRVPDEIATEFEETIREVTKHSRRHALAGSEESAD